MLPDKEGKGERGSKEQLIDGNLRCDAARAAEQHKAIELLIKQMAGWTIYEATPRQHSPCSLHIPWLGRLQCLTHNISTA